MRQFSVWRFRDGRRWLVRVEPEAFYHFYWGFSRFVKEL